LFAANEALAQDPGSVTAVAAATGVARSTINRSIKNLLLGHNPIGERARGGGDRKSAVAQYYSPECGFGRPVLCTDL